MSLGTSRTALSLVERGQPGAGEVYSGRWFGFTHVELRHMRTGLSFKYIPKADGFPDPRPCPGSAAEVGRWAASCQPGGITELESPDTAEQSRGLGGEALAEDRVWGQSGGARWGEGSSGEAWYPGNQAGRR